MVPTLWFRKFASRLPRGFPLALSLLALPRAGMSARACSLRPACGRGGGAARRCRVARCHAAAAAALAAPPDAPSAAPSEPPPAGQQPPQPTVFVAGATGKLGALVASELAGRGFRVRAGARAPSRVAPAPNLTAVAYEAKGDAPSLAAALGGATLVVCCLGAPVADGPSGPRSVDGDATIALVEASKLAGVSHFVLISSLGTGRFGWPASLLNLFWNVLAEKARAEAALVASGVPFTILRPGGLERLPASSMATHGLMLRPADSAWGGQVSRAAVAALCGDILSPPIAAAAGGGATNRVVEVTAVEGLPVRPLARQLAAILPVPGAGASGADAFTRRFAGANAAPPPPAAGGAPLAAFLELMAFSGAAPELVNARAAMVAAAVMLPAELATGHPTLLQQAAVPGALAAAAAVAAAVGAASAAPLAARVRPAWAEAGPFTAAAELFNGRLAMLALASAAAAEVWGGGGPAVALPPWLL